MAVEKKKSSGSAGAGAAASSSKGKKPAPGAGSSRDATATAAPPASTIRTAPSFTSALKEEEMDFPRGGGTSLTALEMKQIRDEGRREADEEVAKESSASGVKRKRPVSEREARRIKKSEPRKKVVDDADTIRVEELNYKRLVPGTRTLARVHTVLPLHLILSLPNNLLAHVPITEISSTLTQLLTAEQDAMSDDEEDEEEEEDEEDEDSPSKTTAPDLASLFKPGQYFPAKVLVNYPTASQSFVSQYPVTETTKLAARVEMTLSPEKVNAEIAKADLEKGYLVWAEVRGEEDKGWRVGLGLGDETGLEGWIKSEEVDAHAPSKTLIPGQLIATTVTSLAAGGRVVNLSLDPTAIAHAQLSEVSNVGSLLPGHQVSALITAVVPSGLNVKICGFYDGTLELSHLGLGEESIEDRFKVGKKLRARVNYENLSQTPRQFALSVLPHILNLSSPLNASKVAVEEALPIGKLIHAVTVSRIIPDFGLVCRTDDGFEAFVHISHVSDTRLPALSRSTGQYAPGTVHRARVIGHSPLDGVALLSFEQKVIDQLFAQVSELEIGQTIKATIRRLTDKALFLDLSGAVDGVVFPHHYADIQLKHPEKRFKVGNSVKARVWEIEPARNRVLLTLKRTLVDSEVPVPKTFADVKTGVVVDAVVVKVLPKGVAVQIWGGYRAFVPQSEASQTFISKLSDIFHVGKPLQVRITEINSENGHIIASARAAAPTATAAAALEVGDAVSGLVTAVHAEQVAMSLVPSQLTALLSLSNLSNHRHMGVEEVRASLKVGETLNDLIVVSKNPTTGLVIVANKRAPKTAASDSTASAAGPSSSGANGAGSSRMGISYNTLAAGQTVSGRVVSHSVQGAVVQLSNSVRGRVHPCDATDDFATAPTIEDALPVGKQVQCSVLKVNPHSHIIDLSTRPSRLDTSANSTVEVVDPEVEKVDGLKPEQKIKGYVKNVAASGVFVAIGRTITARIMIKDLFDEYVKDWSSKFEVGQLVSGKIVSADAKNKLVEMSLRKETGTSGGGRKKEARAGLGEFEVGQIVDAVVKKVEAYGMFLQVDGSDVRGLCHKSEISDDKKRDVSAALKGFREGDRVKAKIVSIDRASGKINFGIKASYFADEADEDEEEDGAMDQDDDEAEADDDDDEEADEDEDGAMDEDEGEDEDEDEDEDDDDDDDQVMIDLSSLSAPVSKIGKSRKAASSSAAAAPLEVSGGFDWTGDGAGSDADSDSEAGSDEDDDDKEVQAPAATGASSSKKGGKKGAAAAGGAVDLTGTAPDAQPESSAEFERALLASPNSSFLWIQYMSFLLQLHEIEKARRIGRQALEKISYREEEEKLNVWMALVNLELGFGTMETAEKVFKEAAQYNDARTAWTRYAEALAAAGKDEAVEETHKKIVKKFSAYPDSWTKFAEYYLKKGNLDEARALLPRSLKSLDKSKHVETIEKMAVLEFKHGETERGKTLFEGLVDRSPKRLDLWSVYIDQLAKTGDIQGCRSLFGRALDQKLTAKKAKFLFKKWFNVEARIGDAAGQEKAKQQAKAWVEANTKPDEADEAGEAEESDEE